MLSMLRTVASRSANSSSELQQRHHTRRSVSEGARLPYSSRDTLEECHPAIAAKATPDKPASLRTSLRRLPRASWARRAGVDIETIGQAAYFAYGTARDHTWSLTRRHCLNRYGSSRRAKPPD